jgi:acetyltransferase-like isoleucine patch superfamily enzyme
MDIGGMFIMSIPALLTFTALFSICNLLKVIIIYKIIISAILLPFLFILSCFIVRILLPRLKKGTITPGANKKYLTWALHLSLGRAIRIFQLKDLIYSSYLLKYLYWRAMGANIAFGVNSSMYVNIIDLPLVTIEKNVTLGDQVQLSCHILANGRLVLGEIFIGENSFISFDTQIGPMTKIGKNCFVGPDQNHIKLKLKDGERT